MKKIIIPIVCASIAVLFSSTSCGGQKQVVNAGKTEIVMPFSTPEYRTDMDYFRATASGSSKNLEMARTAADLNARTSVATQVTAILKAVTERYMNQVDIDTDSEFAQKIEQNVRLVVNQEMQAAIIKDTKVYQNPDGSYEYWINVEMPRAAVMDGIEEMVSKDEKLAVDFDQHLFMKTFEEEMAEYQKSTGR